MVQKSLKIQDLPSEIIYFIFQFLTNPNDLIRVAQVCLQWKQVGNNNILWKALCKERWKKKKGMELEVSYRADYSDIHADLTMKEIKNVLSKRGVYCKGLLERSEFVDLLTATTPKPFYGRFASKWKAAYIVAEKDSKRTQITKDELCSISWDFKFNQWPEDHPGGAIAKFQTDYTYESNIFEQKMKWRFYAGQIQVEAYPPLSCYRHDDWSWGIENGFVTYTQI